MKTKKHQNSLKFKIHLHSRILQSCFQRKFNDIRKAHNVILNIKTLYYAIFFMIPMSLNYMCINVYVYTQNYNRIFKGDGIISLVFFFNFSLFLKFPHCPCITL